MGSIQKLDNLWANWFESGLWFLAMVLTGVVACFILCYSLLHTFQYLKKHLVFKNEEGE